MVPVWITAWKVSKYGFFFGPHFPVFSLNTEKYGPEKIPYLGTFHAVNVNTYLHFLNHWVHAYYFSVSPDLVHRSCIPQILWDCPSAINYSHRQLHLKCYGDHRYVPENYQDLKNYQLFRNSQFTKIFVLPFSFCRLSWKCST